MTARATVMAQGETSAAFLAVTAVTAVTAAAVTLVSIAVALPAWAVFIGWVAHDTRGQSTFDGIANVACMLLGIAMGVAAALATTILTPALGDAAAAVVIFGLVMVVVSLRVAPVVNNVLSYFLGVISFFAAQVDPTFSAFVGLIAAGALGGLAAWASRTAQSRIAAVA